MCAMRLSPQQFDRFWDKINTENGCWIWCGATTTKGYGHLTLYRRDFQAHRIAYEVFKGRIPNGECVLHKCDVKRCVNPDHLFTGTIADNNTDKVRKNRQPRGESHGAARLRASEVREIRRQAHDEDTTYVAIAKRFGVSGPYISAIVNRRKWRHI